MSRGSMVRTNSSHNYSAAAHIARARAAALAPSPPCAVDTLRAAPWRQAQEAREAREAEEVGEAWTVGEAHAVGEVGEIGGV